MGILGILRIKQFKVLGDRMPDTVASVEVSDTLVQGSDIHDH
jgi:hypothetical protein